MVSMKTIAGTPKCMWMVTVIKKKACIMVICFHAMMSRVVAPFH